MPQSLVMFLMFTLSPGDLIDEIDKTFFIFLIPSLGVKGARTGIAAFSL
jgi:hypothetical protein